MKKNIQLFLYTVLGCFLLSFAIILFVAPAKLAPGGMSGTSLILYETFGIPIYGSQLFLQIVFQVLAYLFLSREFARMTIVSTFLVPLFTYLLKDVPPVTEDMFLASVFGGIIVGVGIGIVFKAGASTGGFDVISKIMNEKFYVSYGATVLIIDSIVITLGGILFGMDVALYSLVFTVVTSFTVDRVQRGFTTSSTVLIISDHYDDVSHVILAHLERGGTFIPGKGMYTEGEKQIILSVVQSREYMQLKKDILRIDPKAFIISLNTNEVHGEGFTLPIY